MDLQSANNLYEAQAAASRRAQMASRLAPQQQGSQRCSTSSTLCTLILLALLCSTSGLVLGSQLRQQLNEANLTQALWLPEVGPLGNASTGQPTSQAYLDRRNFGHRLSAASNSSSLVQGNSSGVWPLESEPASAQSVHQRDYETTKLGGAERRELYLHPIGSGASVLEGWSRLLVPNRAPINSSSADEALDEQVASEAQESQENSVQQVNYVPHLQVDVAQNGSAPADSAEQSWQASDLEHVIHTAQEGQEPSSQGQQQQQQAGQSQAQAGERLHKHEHSGQWQRIKSGREATDNERKQEQDKEDSWQKDLGHNKHGWKNVYHKEEYAQHQKYHDLYRDKDWDQNKAKTEDSHASSKGSEYKQVLSNQFYDKDKHGSKYDYTRGNQWKRLEDDSNAHLQQQQQREQGAYGEPSASSTDETSQSSQQESGEPDEAVIEQMRSRLDRLSSAGSRKHSSANDERPARYSINQILKSARKSTKESSRAELADASSQLADTSADELEHEQEPAPRAEKNRKNELRLKLELNLGKSDGQKVDREPHTSQTRRNLTGAEQAAPWQPAPKQTPADPRGAWQPKQPSEPSFEAHKDAELRPELPGRLHKVAFDQDDQKSGVKSARVSARRKVSDKGQQPPSQPIYVKHLEMNGGVMLGKFSGSPNTRVEPVDAPKRTTKSAAARRSKHRKPQIASHTASPLNADNFSIETSLTSALGDQDGLVSPVQFNDEPVAPFHSNAFASDNLAKPGEYMLLFGGSGDSSARESRQHASVRAKPMAPAGEPHVIFEAAASSLDQERQPLFQADQDDFLDYRAPLSVSPAVNTRQPSRLLGQDYRLANLLRLTPFASASSPTMVVPSVQQAFGRLLRLPARMFSSSSLTSQPVDEQRAAMSQAWPNRLYQAQQQPEESQLQLTHWPPISLMPIDESEIIHQSTRSQASAQSQLARPLELGDFMEAASSFPRAMAHLVAPASPMIPVGAHLPALYMPTSTERPRAGPTGGGSGDSKRLLRKKNKDDGATMTPSKRKKVIGEGMLNQLGSQWKKPLRFESNYTVTSALLPAVLTPFKWSSHEQQAEFAASRKRPAKIDGDLMAPASSGLVATLRRAPASPLAESRARQPASESNKRARQPKSTRAPHFGLRVLESFKSKLGAGRMARGAGPRALAGGL